MSLDYSVNFLKVPRELVKMLARHPELMSLCLVLLERARWKAGPFVGDRGVLQLGVGQCVAGRDELAVATGLTPSKVRTGLKRLEALQILAIKTTTLGTIVTFPNYGESGDTRDSKSPARSPVVDQTFARPSPNLRHAIATNEDGRLQDVNTQEGEIPDPLDVLMDGFGALFRSSTGSTCTWLESQKQKGRAMLKHHSAEELVRRARNMFGLPHDTFPKTRDFDTLIQHVDKFAEDWGPLWTAPIVSTYPAHKRFPEDVVTAYDEFGFPDDDVKETA
jgi:hypothetical protein